MGRARAAFIAVPIAIAALTACQVIADIHELPTGSASTDASVDASSAEAAAPTGACTPGSTWPGPPDATAALGGDDLLLAVDELNIGVMPDGGGPAGFDLDCASTGASLADGGTAPESCRVHASAFPHVDEPGGRDDGFYTMVKKLGSTGLSQLFEPNPLIQQGKTTLLLQIKDYSGAESDSVVYVNGFFSGGLQSDGGAEAGVVWGVDPRSANATMGSVSVTGAHVSKSAYVTGGVLVAFFDAMWIPLVVPSDGDPQTELGPATASVSWVDIDSAVIVARIVKDGASFRLEDGHITGRLSTRGALTALGPVPDLMASGAASDAERFCNEGDIGVHAAIKNAFCTGADIARSPGSDNKPMAVCDSVSIAYGFRASPANVADALSYPIPTGCDASFSEDCPADWP